MAEVALEATTAPPPTDLTDPTETASRTDLHGFTFANFDNPLAHSCTTAALQNFPVYPSFASDP